MKIIKVSNASDYEKTIRDELCAIGHSGSVTVRHFEISTADIDHHTFIQLGPDIDRLEIVKKNGTDRTLESLFWNEKDHDYDHDKNPSGKKANEIIYAFTITLQKDGGYIVNLLDRDEHISLENDFEENIGVLVYDTRLLERVSENEYWFTGNPKDALLFVMVLDS